MERRRLGKTDMEVSVLGFGGAEIGYARVAPARVGRLLGSALDAGLNAIDTAECYAVECGRFDTLQTSISIADQAVLDLALPLARRRGLGVIAKRPIANVAWTYAREPRERYYQAYWRRLRALGYDFLRDGADAAVGIALRFTLGIPGVDTAIVGTTKPDRWRGNAALQAAGPLPPARVAKIRARWREVARPSWV